MSDQPRDMEKFLQVSERDALQSGEPAHVPERRSHPRRRVASLEYVDLGEGNGGIIINLGEDGMYVQAVGGLADAELPLITFRVPESGYRVETSGQIIWTGESKKDAGIQFVSLPEEARAKIREWVASEKLAVENAYEFDARPETIRKRRERIPEIPRTRAPEKIAPKPLVVDEPVPPAAQLSDPTTILKPAIFDSATPLDLSAPEDFTQVPSEETAPPSRLAAAFESARLYVLQQSRVGFAIILALVAGVSLLAGWMATRSSRSKAELAANTSQTTGAPAPANIGQPQASSIPATVTSRPVPNPPSRENAAGPAPASANPPRSDGNSSGRAADPPPVRAAAPAASTSAVSTTPAPRAAAPPRTNAVTTAPPTPANPNAAPAQTAPSSQAPPAINASANTTPSPSANKPPVTQPPVAAEKSPTPVPAPASQKLPEPAPEIVKGTVSVSASPYPSIRVPPELKSKLSAEGASLQIGQLISRVEPIYPESAERERIEGVVKLRAIIGTDGAVRDIEQSSGPPPLVIAAAAAVHQWRYSPTSLGGQPVEAAVSITLTFRLQVSHASAN